MAELITVRALRQDNHIVLVESDPAHPGGIVAIRGDGQDYEVARTPEIERRLREGVLVQVGEVGEMPTEVSAETSSEPVELPAPTDDEIVALIPAYTTLNATDIIDMASKLTRAEREAVRKYEAAHLNRKTVIAALAQE